MKSFIKFSLSSFFVFLSLLFLFNKAPSIYGQTCQPHYQSCDATHPCCDYPAWDCVGGYCVATTSVTPTPTPNFATCTGFDGVDPCQQYPCTGTPNSACEAHQGQCINGYCYPQDCRCGHSQDDCPSSWTCKTTTSPYSCSPTDAFVECSAGYLNCTGGNGVPCADDTACQYECADLTAYCHPLYGCYVPSSCGALEEGAGSCATPDECPDDRERGQIDCLPGEVCCAPDAECIGVTTNLPGDCVLLNCPPGTMYDGSNPPYEICNLGYFCCVPPPGIIEIPALEPNCIAGGNEEGINTAIGCIPVTSSAALASFWIRFGIGLGGGIAFLMIMISSLQIITSAGNPDRLKAGKELLFSAIGGLLLIIFSIFLLELVGVKILRLPGF